MAKHKQRTPPVQEESGSIDYLIFIFHYFSQFLNKFGAPMGVILLAYGFIVKYATLDQKQQMIDMFILFKNPGMINPVSVALFFLVLLFYDVWFHRRQIKIRDQEIDRLSSMKTAEQKSKLGTKIHSTK